MTENSNQVEPEYHWISSLNEESTNWSLKCQLIQIGDVRFFNNEKGFGSLLKVVLVDKEGERIQAAMFNDAIKTFESSLNIGHSYVISNGRIKEAVPKYNVGTTKYEIILDSKSQLTETENFHHGQQLVKFCFTPLESLQDYITSSQLIDVIGIVIAIKKETYSTKRSNGTEVLRRDLVITDKSCSLPIQLTLWGRLAIIEGDAINAVIQDRPIIVATSIKVQDYKGLSLSTTSGTILQVNPVMDDVNDLKTWAENNIDEITSRFSKISSKFETIVKVERANISEILQIVNNGLSQPMTFKIEASPTELNTRQDPWYIACKKCHVKVVDADGKFFCKKCKKDSVTTEFRYILRLKIKDETGELWISLFNKEVEKLFNCQVEELYKLKECNISEFITCMERCLNKDFSFTIKVSDSDNETHKNHRYTCEALENPPLFAKNELEEETHGATATTKELSKNKKKRNINANDDGISSESSKQKVSSTKKRNKKIVKYDTADE